MPLFKGNTVAIFAHVRPDGDTLGSMLGLYNALISAGVTVHLFCDSPIPPSFARLSGYFAINAVPFGSYDTLVAVDVADSARLGKYQQEFARHPYTVCIDHHVTNPRYAKVNLVESCAATCELVYRTLVQEGLPVDRAVAECLYTGIITDTGCFAQSNTTPRTFAIAQELLAYGIDASELYDRFIALLPYGKLKLIAHVIDTMRFFENGRIALGLIALKDFKAYGVAPHDTEGIVRYPFYCNGVQIAVLLSEATPHDFKISLRSRAPIDVSAVATQFCGGGHSRAAGGQLSGLTEEVVETVVRACALELPA
ncbi:MAG: bifunctional oligoribonuclease/PAP phosphatase NrnA [Clostridiales bacterium]|jgi:phosphoesterase RecJ-like protein|nr:bifunctional oligoribonuclease/PAP phosphatase NrnA [Clostridiales bacterium]